MQYFAGRPCPAVPGGDVIEGGTLDHGQKEHWADPGGRRRGQKRRQGLDWGWDNTGHQFDSHRCQCALFGTRSGWGRASTSIELIVGLDSSVVPVESFSSAPVQSGKQDHRSRSSDESRGGVEEKGEKCHSVSCTLTKSIIPATIPCTTLFLSATPAALFHVTDGLGTTISCLAVGFRARFARPSGRALSPSTTTRISKSKEVEAR